MAIVTSSLAQRPIPGYWYSSQEGRLLQVRAILYEAGRHTMIVIEGIGGDRENLSPEEWNRRDLLIHSAPHASVHW